MIDQRCCIILPTNSKYIDVCKNFVDLLKRNWPDCPYPLVVSVTGEDKKVKGTENLYNGTDATLINCVVNASETYNYDYYMIFLGDSFMCATVDTQKVKDLINDMLINELDYCCLYPEKSRMKIKKVGKQMRLTHIRDRYCHCFGYLLCNKKYIREMFIESGITTDIQYEIWYLKKTLESDTNYYYMHDAALINNIFNIKRGIKKGKWDRGVYRLMKKQYPDIQLAIRPRLSILEQMIMSIRNKTIYIIPDKLRIYIKKTISKLMKRNPFDTMT